MKKHVTLYLIIALCLALLIGACAKEKVEEPTVVAPKPLALAKAASEAGTNAYEEKSLQDAVDSFKKAIVFYGEARETALESDSIDVNIELMHIVLTKVYMDMAAESSALEMHDDAIQELQEALDTFSQIAPLTMQASEKDEIIKSLYLRMAFAQTAGGMYEEALQSYDKFLKMEPGNEEILNLKYVLLNDNIKDEARAFKVLKDYADASQDYKAYLILGNRYSEKNNYNEAVKYYEIAITLNSSAEVLNRVSDFYRSNNKWTDSNRILEKLLASGPDNATKASIYRLMGSNFDMLKNNSKKIEAWEKSVTFERNADISLAITKHYYDAKNYNKAITYATQVISQDPNNAAAYLFRGDSYFRLNKKTEAKADLNRIVNDRQYGATAQKLLKSIK